MRILVAERRSNGEVVNSNQVHLNLCFPQLTAINHQLPVERTIEEAILIGSVYTWYWWYCPGELDQSDILHVVVIVGGPIRIRPTCSGGEPNPRLPIAIHSSAILGGAARVDLRVVILLVTISGAKIPVSFRPPIHLRTGVLFCVGH